MRTVILAASVFAAVALLGLVVPGRATATQCVPERELAASAAVNFVGHVVTLERDKGRATVVIDSVAAGRDLRRGDRVSVLDTSPPRTEIAGKLLVGARYRFLPTLEARPFRINGCSAKRLGGFVLPPTAVREVAPDWMLPAMGFLFVLGGVAGAWVMRRRATRRR